MNCGDIVRLAPLYVTGELEAELSARFDAHLKTCAACMGEVERQARLDARLREMILTQDLQTNVAEADRRVRELMLAQVDGLPTAKPPRPLRRAARVAAGLAGALLLLALGYGLLHVARVAPVYRAAARDHQIEIIEQLPRQWLTDPQEIASVAQRGGVSRAAISALTSGGYRLLRGKLCFLDRRVFLHLVFSSGGREFSVYLRQRDGASPGGAAREIVNGKPLCATEVDQEHLASIETDRLLVLVVSDESSDAALNFGRFASAVL